MYKYILFNFLAIFYIMKYAKYIKMNFKLTKKCFIFQFLRYLFVIVIRFVIAIVCAPLYEEKAFVVVNKKKFYP